MSASIAREALLVNLIGIDQRNKNAIEMVLAKRQGLCVISTVEDSLVSIVDLDKYGAAEEWEALQLIKPEQLAIFLSVSELTKNSAHVILKKPVTILDLVSALNKARKKLGLEVLSEKIQPPSWGKFISSRNEPPLDEDFSTGNSLDPVILTNEISFLAEHGYLIDVVKRAVVQANDEGLGIKLQIANQGSIFIDPTEHRVNTDLDTSVLKDLCNHSLNEADIVKRVFTDNEFTKYLEEWRDMELTPIDIDSFLWNLALWTYQGSIPSNTDLNKKIVLTHWPDLPRLTLIPNAMRIAALWVSCPMTLTETIDVLKIKKTDVFNFYTAASTLGLVRQSEQAFKNVQVESLGETSSKKREFYLRIIKHLKGPDLNG